MRCAEHVARLGETKISSIKTANLTEEIYFGSTGVYGRIILKYVLKE
jgi:hypothetical protein